MNLQGRDHEAPPNLIVNFPPTGMIPTKEMTPHVPVNVDEIVEDVYRAVRIGNHDGPLARPR